MSLLLLITSLLFQADVQESDASYDWIPVASHYADDNRIEFALHSKRSNRFEVGKTIEFRMDVINHGGVGNVSVMGSIDSCVCGGTGTAISRVIEPHSTEELEIPVIVELGSVAVEFSISWSSGSSKGSADFEYNYVGEDVLQFSVSAGEAMLEHTTVAESTISVHHLSGLGVGHVVAQQVKGLSLQHFRDEAGGSYWTYTMPVNAPTKLSASPLPPITLFSSESGRSIWRTSESEALVNYVPCFPQSSEYFCTYRLFLDEKASENSELPQVTLVGETPVVIERVSVIDGRVAIDFIGLSPSKDLSRCSLVSAVGQNCAVVVPVRFVAGS